MTVTESQSPLRCPPVVDSPPRRAGRHPRAVSAHMALCLRLRDVRHLLFHGGVSERGARRVSGRTARDAVRFRSDRRVLRSRFRLSGRCRRAAQPPAAAQTAFHRDGAGPPPVFSGRAALAVFHPRDAPADLVHRRRAGAARRRPAVRHAALLLLDGRPGAGGDDEPPLGVAPAPDHDVDDSGQLHPGFRTLLFRTPPPGDPGLSVLRGAGGDRRCNRHHSVLRGPRASQPPRAARPAARGADSTVSRPRLPPLPDLHDFLVRDHDDGGAVFLRVHGVSASECRSWRCSS